MENSHWQPVAPVPQIKPNRARPIGLIVAVVVVIVLAIVGGVAYAMISGMWNPFGPKPETIILKAWNNLENIESQNFNSEFSISSKNLKQKGIGGSFDITAKANGGVDSVNKLADVKASLTASATDETSNKFKISLAGSAKLIQKDLYLQLDNVDLGGLDFVLMMFGIPDLNTFKGQWIKIPLNTASQDDLAKQLGSISGQKTGVSQNLQDAMNKIVKILLVDKKVYDIKNASGLDEYHYIISLNKKKLLAATPDLLKVFQELDEKEGITPPTNTSLESFKKDINDFFNKFGSLSADLYIGKSDNFFHKIQFSKNFDVNKINSEITGTVSVNYKMEQAEINKPVLVVAPEKYVNLQDFIAPMIKQKMLEKTFGEISATAGGLLAYGVENYSSVCKNASITKLLGDLKNQGVKSVVCFAGTANYCVSGQLEDKTYVCAGANGAFGITKCLSAKTICR